MNQVGQYRNVLITIWSIDFDKVPMPFNGARIVFSTNDAEMIEHLCAKQEQNPKNLNLHFIPYTKIKLNLSIYHISNAKSKL